jgi:hypothetical protein
MPPKEDKDKKKSKEKKGALFDLEVLRDSLEGGQDVDSRMLLSGILQIVKMLDERNKEVETLKKELSAVHSEVADLKKIVHGHEFERVKNNVIVSGLALHKDAKERESVDQIKDVVGWMFGEMDLDHKKAKIDQCYRLPGKPDQKGPPLLKIQFSREMDKKAFFAALPNLRKSTKKISIGISDEIPSYLKEQFKMLSEKAYKLRKDKGCKTRIVVKFSGLVLLRKDKGAERFAECL